MKKIQNKDIIIDTNIIIQAAKNYDNFKVFFDELRKHNINAGIDQAIKLEFLRTSNSPKTLQKKIDYLELFFGGEKNRMVLPITEETFNDANYLSMLYNFLNIKKKQNISAVDCLIAAQLKKYKNNLFLATLNNDDFTTKIFDRLYIRTIETNDHIHNIGIYQFSETKYKEILRRFINLGLKEKVQFKKT